MSSSTQSDYLNIAHFEPCSIVNGPGQRFVLWMQGCSLQCPGCFNSDMLSTEPKMMLKCEEIANIILQQQNIDGLTITGGEPFEQAEGVFNLCSRIQRYVPYLSIMAYSGYTFETLFQKGDIWQKRLLQQIDILVDGPFIEAQKAPLKWRGSRNQRILFLNDRYFPESIEMADGRSEVEMIVSPYGEVTITGFPGIVWNEDELWNTLKGVGLEIRETKSISVGEV